MLVGALTATTLVLAACSSDDTSSTGTAATEDTGATDNSEPTENSTVSTEESVQLTQSDAWCTEQDIVFFVGGDGGDTFSSVVLNGAEAAEADLGAQVEYIFSGWDPEKMLSQLRDSIARQPDGIAMMGHAGDEALTPLAEEAEAAGITMHYQNVDVPTLRAATGAGFSGSDQEAQGRDVALKAIRDFDLSSGTAIVFGAFGSPGREIREEAAAVAFEDAGLNVERLVAGPETGADPLLLSPQVTAALESNTDAVVLVLPGGQTLGIAEQYLEAAGKAPGDIAVVGFDLSEQVLGAIDGGFVQITADQQPYLQGYMPILSLCMQLEYDMSPLNTNTGAGFVTADNVADVVALVEAGKR